MTSLYEEFLRRKLFPTKDELKQQWLRKCYLTFKIMGAFLWSYLCSTVLAVQESTAPTWPEICIVQLLLFLPCYLLITQANNIIDCKHVNNYEGYKF